MMVVGKILCFASLLILYEVNATNNATRFREGSVLCKNRKCQFTAKLDRETATVVGAFNDTLLLTGWGILDISAGRGKDKFSNDDIMFGAGFLEGVLTAHQIENHFHDFHLVKKEVKSLKTWFGKQRAWTDRMVSGHRDSPYWRMMGYILAQFDGLYAGYKSVRPNDDAPIDKFALEVMNADGDAMDILSSLDPESAPDWTKFSMEEARRHFYSRVHCSALIKLTPGFENMFMSHSTWDGYGTSNRIYKHYDLNLDEKMAFGKKMSFSSYPGYLVSVDDFYQMGSGLVMLETTIVVFNSSLFNKVHPESLLSWQRVRLANMMATTGQMWADVFKKYNSGTYNNEYMLIDLNRFTPKKSLPDGTLWVVNQIPGLVVHGDATHVLRTGYFPSYNIAFFEEIFNQSGNLDFVKRHGNEFSYDLNPRAEIFRRDAGKVVNMEEMKAIMRYNDYKHDEYSNANPNNAICSRGDLSKKYFSTSGCTDTKVSDYTMSRALQADIINGPTQSHGLPPFRWADYFPSMKLHGLPPVYDFPFLRTKPRF